MSANKTLQPTLKNRATELFVIFPESRMNEKFNKEFNDIRLRQYSIAMEALNDLFHRIPFGEEIQFSDGRTGTIRPL